MDKIGRRNLKTFSAGAALNDIGEEMYAPYLPYFAATFLGVSGFQYGLIEGICEGINRIMRLFTGSFTDRVGRKIPVILAYILIPLSRLGLTLVKGWAGFIPFRGLRQIGRSLRDPAREASIGESVPQTERGRAFGILNMVDTIGAVLGPVIGVLILYWATVGLKGTTPAIGSPLEIWGGLKTVFPKESYIYLFIWAALPTIISAWIIYFFLFETRMPFAKPAKTQAKPQKKQEDFSLRTFISTLKPNSPFRKLGYTTLSHMILALGAVPVSMILFYASNKLSAAPIENGILFITYAISHFLTSYPAGWLSDRLGRFYTQVMGNILFILALILIIFVRSPLFLIVPLILYATFESIWITNRRAAIADLSKTEAFGKTFGNFSALYGFPSIICPILFGAIWSLLGSGFALFVSALFPLTAIFILPQKN
jgi:MFS family permease